MTKINRKVSQFFSALSDETRLKILLTLAEEPKNVNEIHNALEKEKITLSAISHQLKNLSNLDIILYKKKGREKIYWLSNNFCWCTLRNAVKHFDNEKIKKGK